MKLLKKVKIMLKWQVLINL